MRVLVVSHYFPPEVGAPQARLGELARFWTEAGVDVTVLTGMPNHPSGVVHADYRRSVVRRERRDGYEVVRTWLYATPNEGFLRKTLGHLSFLGSAASLGSWTVPRPDVVVVSSPTFFSIGAAWFTARLRRSRFVVEVRDLWPAVFVDLGVLTNPWVIRVLERLELAAYRAADAVVVLSEGFRDDLLRRGVPAEKVVTIRNGVDLERFEPDAAPDPQVRARLGARPGDLLVLYLGAHGISHGLRSVVQSAARLQGRGVHVALVGEGADKVAVARSVQELGVGNVTMLPAVPREQVPALVAAADVCLVPLRDVPLFSTFIPSKIFEYLAAGKPVVGSVRGEAAAILAAAGALVVPPEDPEALADALLELRRDPARREQVGRRGRAYVERHFDRRALAATYRGLLQAVTAGGSSARGAAATPASRADTRAALQRGAP